MADRCPSAPNDLQCQRDTAHPGWHAYVDGVYYAVAWAPSLHYEGDAFDLALEALYDARAKALVR